MTPRRIRLARIKGQWRYEPETPRWAHPALSPFWERVRQMLAGENVTPDGGA